MNGLIAVIMMLFLATGAAYGKGAKTMKSLTEIIKAMEKALSSLGSLLLLLFVISQFVAYFNYSNMGTIMAVKMAGALQTANLDPIWLLIGFIVVVGFIDLFSGGMFRRLTIITPHIEPPCSAGVIAQRARSSWRMSGSPLTGPARAHVSQRWW